MSRAHEGIEIDPKTGKKTDARFHGDMKPDDPHRHSHNTMLHAVRLGMSPERAAKLYGHREK